MREVQVVARGSSGVLIRHFKKLDRDTRLKAVQVHWRMKFRNATVESSGALTREVHVGGTSRSLSTLMRQFRKLDRGTRLQAVQLH
jgi:hypothetical protein